MPGDSPGLRYLNDLRLGYDELTWLQDNYDLHARLERLSHAYEPGWVGGNWLADGSNGFGWSIIDGGSGNLAIDSIDGGDESLALFRRRNNSLAPAMGVDPDGKLLLFYPNDGQLLRDSSGTLISVPDDGVWRTLVARATLAQRAPGLLDMTASVAAVTGDGTRLTRYADSSDTRATKIRVPAGFSNEGDYEFATVTDDTNATLTPAPSATESDVPFIVVGDFASGVADEDIHNELVVTWELVTRTVTPPTDALFAYDCMRTGGTLSLIDRRRANIYRPAVVNHERRWHIVPELVLGAAAAAQTDYPAVEQSAARALYYAPCTSTDSSIFCAVAPAGVGADLQQGADVASGLLGAFVKDATNWRIELREYVPQAYVQGTSSGNPEAPWRDLDGGSPVNPVTAQTGSCNGLALLAVPSGSGNTHIMWYIDNSGDVYQMSSSDNGATWTSASAIWNATAALGLGLAAVLTRTGRIILVTCHDSGTDVRYIYSDDLGTTWDTNSTAGYDILAGSSGDYGYPSIAEDDLGNLWTAVTDTSGTNDVIVLVRGTDLNDPTPSSDTPSGGWIVSPDISLNGTAPPTDFDSAQVLPCPDGQVMVWMIGKRDGAFAEMGVAITTRGELTRYRYLNHPGDTSVTAAGHIPHALCQDAHGIIHSVYADLEAGNDAFRDVHYLCVPIQRMAAQRYGGV